MAGFTLRQSDTPPLVEKWTKSSSSDTGVVGDVYYWEVGADAALPGSSSTESNDRVGILTKDTVDGDTTIEVQIPTPIHLWEAKGANDSSSTHTGFNMLLSSQNTVNNATTSTAVEAIIVQVDTIGVVSDKRLLVRFSQMGNGLATF